MDENTTFDQDLEEIISKFKTERAALQDRVKADTSKIDRLSRVIEALEAPSTTRAPAPEPAVKRPSVADMAEAAIGQMHNGTTFDAQSLREKMLNLYPDPADMPRIKRGVYNALAFLQKHNKVERCPGGFRPVRPVSQPV